MKKFIKNTVIFLFLAILFYVNLLFIWGRYSPSIIKSNMNYRIGSHGHLYTRLSEVKDYGDVDVLFLGSSHTYRGFDTRIFAASGYRTFNLGSSAQTPIQTKVLLNRYLEDLNPELIVYEVYPTTFTIDGVESSLDIIANDQNDSHSLDMALETDNIKTYNTMIYGFICDLLGLNKSFSEPDVKGKDQYISGGYVEKEVDFYQPIKLEEQEISLKDDQLDAFSEIVQSLENRNIELILVYAPIPKATYKSYTNNRYFDSIMGNQAEYYNFNKILDLDDTQHFYDSNHLNQKGVDIFNEKLIELLNSKNARTQSE